MNKKQVGALLKVISKDTTRPILCNAYVGTWNDTPVLVATDGYKLSVSYVEGADELVGKLIRRDALERWYKLATGKDRLTGDELVRVSSDDYAQHGSYESGQYPDWASLIPLGEPSGQDTMAFNAEYFKIIQDLDGDDSLRVTLYGALSPMVVKTERGIYVIMPMRKM